MKTPWYVGDPMLLDKIRVEIRTNFPSLFVIVEEGKVFIRGYLQLRDKTTGKFIDEYDIEIELAHNHPHDTPIVRERAGRIPKIADRHVNNDGSLCLFVYDARWKHYCWGMTLTEFIAQTVTPFFLGQSLYEQNREMPFGELPHGVDGILDFYYGELGVKDKVVVIKFLEYLSRSKIRDNWICYCGSEKTLRSCHIQQLMFYRSRIGVKRGTDSLKRIKYPDYKNKSTR